MTEVIGAYDKIRRIDTGIFSMNQALRNDVTGENGFPIRTITEIFGNPGLGKSSLSYYLSGEITRQVNPTGTVALLDLEGMDSEHLPKAISTGGFSGKVQIVEAIDNKGKPKSHESMLDEWIDLLDTPEAVCGIVDSIGAISPISEREAGIEEGFGAKRAVAVSRFIRKLMATIRESPDPKVALLTNHVHVAIGGVGHTTTGGVQLSFAAATRIYIYNSSKDVIKSGDEVIANVLVGKLEKLRYGGKGREFKFVIIPGRGCRPLLTSVIDCITYEIATRGVTVKLGEKSYGRISEIVQKDIEGDVEFFAPFRNALKGIDNATK
jgi:RecA/RadA recombinase